MNRWGGSIAYPVRAGSMSVLDPELVESAVSVGTWVFVMIEAAYETRAK